MRYRKGRRMYVFVSEDIAMSLEEKLKQRYKVIKVTEDQRVYASIAKHPDIRILPIGRELFIDTLTCERLELKKHVSSDDIGHIRTVDLQLKDTYPATVFLNASYREKMFIHHQVYTHPFISEYIQQHQIKYIHTNQGYTRCCLLQLNQHYGITSDIGMYKQLTKAGLEILKIQEGHIELKGQNYGFIGGTSGVDGNTVYFHGDLQQHPDGEQIKAFIEEKGYNIVHCPGEPLVDIGSILFWGGNR